MKRTTALLQSQNWYDFAHFGSGWLFVVVKVPLISQSDNSAAVLHGGHYVAVTTMEIVY